MTAKCPPPTNAFRDLSRIFANRGDRVLEFEILLPGFGPILEDDNAVGVEKKYLVQAFVTARQVFFDSLKTNHNDTGDDTLSGSKVHGGDESVAVASEIILLFDCEHLTACNWRKKRINSLFNSDKEALIHALNIELSLMTTFLCSSLHRHTKSPTLWQHRRWVQSQLIRLREPDFHGVQEILQIELSVALRAGQLHPRNYYAFSYIRQMYRTLSELGREDSEAWSVQLAQSIVKPTLGWCTLHPGDISGLMFLLYLLDAVPDAPLRLETVTAVVRYALNTDWERESIWTFIDLANRKFNLLESLGDSPVYPWSVLSESPQQGEVKAGPSWKTWLDRARIHWSQGRQITHVPPA
ncbi:hypothetical protein ASPVEDRAFT_134533 [Aspergillus versicolor CBS 583.65]|uniref:Uncharacterized protein n=1 Tax=Aspergillus versicolor CBS 583.65 TaxID=1036611 RepID=A0A1L9PQJ7_ASPVE|nr:uncharacterized protein ASPVEDRAFT_134533 [Aspergillus versicolor CBS 583.65]OJJ03783.1 hypothetical protein ASPVEDRAFT_134533 [Aspergillus versicolor CBS 583.65]